VTHWWEIFADEQGALIIEKHVHQWEFVPSSNPSRPFLRPLGHVTYGGPLPPLSLLGINVERMAVGGRPVTFTNAAQVTGGD
jgi:hypothetical protein